ncbi:unnamed protein product [Haemonchus placei]|uniref:Uncharacterized protein n=1 Tax=Haemonchus placei TaxID=6290 RepID=A0A3P7XI21_HAEPC|nr:unnamed protein product [Haemonchus placei]
MQRVVRERLKEKILEVGHPNPEGPIQQTWSDVVKVTPRCERKMLEETRAVAKAKRTEIDTLRISMVSKERRMSSGW